jgi:hypothetical protein
MLTLITRQRTQTLKSAYQCLYIFCTRLFSLWRKVLAAVASHTSKQSRHPLRNGAKAACILLGPSPTVHQFHNFVEFLGTVLAGKFDNAVIVPKKFGRSANRSWSWWRWEKTWRCPSRTTLCQAAPPCDWLRLGNGCFEPWSKVIMTILTIRSVSFQSHVTAFSDD